jgi:tetratricopeptide (TPR) repeat protein
MPNEKGKVKPKYSKDIKTILGSNLQKLFNGGAYFFDQRDYKKAYDYFNQYMDVTNLPMFEGTPTAAKDTAFMTVQFYAAVAATQLDDSKTAIAALERAKDTDYRRYDVYSYLCYEYEQARDTVNLEKTLAAGHEIFPDSAYFLNSLINIYVYTNRNDKALEALNLAASKQTNDKQLANVYNVLGYVYETGMKDYANAEKNFKLALEKDPTLVEAMASLGRVYYNQGANKRNEADNITDTKQYQEQINIAKDFFKQALPYFKQAHEAKPEEMEYMIVLRNIYYTLDMGAEMKAIEDKMNQ